MDDSARNRRALRAAPASKAGSAGVMHYHGMPITPRWRLQELAGRNFCVPFVDARNIEDCHRIGQSVMLDNGAYGFWKTGEDVDWSAYMNWAEPWLDFPTTWAVIPDVVEGSEEENDQLLNMWYERGLPSGAPVWHLHESIGRLQRLCAGYERVCFGSSGQYSLIGRPAWRRRVSDAFDAIADDGRVPWIHMLRGMAMAGSEFPFGSVDSTDIARNHKRPYNDVRKMAERWDAIQCPARWERVEQLELIQGL